MITANPVSFDTTAASGEVGGAKGKLSEVPTPMETKDADEKVSDQISGLNANTHTSPPTPLTPSRPWDLKPPSPTPATPQGPPPGPLSLVSSPFLADPQSAQDFSSRPPPLKDPVTKLGFVLFTEQVIGAKGQGDMVVWSEDTFFRIRSDINIKPLSAISFSTLYGPAPRW